MKLIASGGKAETGGDAPLLKHGKRDGAAVASRRAGAMKLARVRRHRFVRAPAELS